MENQSDLDWVIPILHKNPSDAIMVLGELLTAGIRSGECSVNDISKYPDDPRLVSAVMKLLKHLGFTHTTEKIHDIRLGKRGKVSLWKLTDQQKVEAFLEYQLQYFTVILHKPL